MLENVCLSAVDRHDPVHHLELALEVPGFDLNPGDAVDVLMDNLIALVAAILDAKQLSGDEAVTMDGEAIREDLAERGLGSLPVRNGVEVVGRDALPQLYDQADQVWQW